MNQNDTNNQANRTSATPKKWKLFLISWLFVYPVINIMFAVVFPLVKDYPQLIKTLIFTVILVPLMGIFIPKLHQRFWSWITK
jgi:antibiotic biosynthesis monooxygenase (ABM) superfamily enzyme